MNSPHIPDDRGVERPLLWPAAWRTLQAERQDDALAALWPEIRARARARRPREVAGHRFVLVCVVCVLGYVLIGSFIGVASKGPVEITMSLACAAVVVSIGIMVMRGMSRVGLVRDKREYARDVAELGHCASCGYPIDHLTPEDDSCVVCPECGAAWRVGETVLEPD